MLCFIANFNLLAKNRILYESSYYLKLILFFPKVHTILKIDFYNSYDIYSMQKNILYFKIMLDLTTKLRLNWSDDVLFFYWSALTRLQTLLFRIPNEGVFQFEIQRTRTLMLFFRFKESIKLSIYRFCSLESWKT